MSRHIGSHAFLLISIFVCFLVLSRSALARECVTLADMQINKTNLLSAAVIPASGNLPGLCRVLSYVRAAINFEIRLPTSDWITKFRISGCGRVAFGGNPKIGQRTANPIVINQPNQQ